ncbi:hypothetical protein AB4Y86_02765 [Arthrobacter sp. 2YAF22_2]|uniref:hypothetical protein n=1 Tax=Arthrobacter sp. 2YAF22_2 TaxID=3233029 RepID=UPI003F90AA11
MNADGDKSNNTGRDGGERRDAQRGSVPAAASPAVPAADLTAGDPRHDPQQRRPKRRAAAPATGPGGVLPNKAAEDDPRRWGDQPGSYDHDAWLLEQKPPHWG